MFVSQDKIWVTLNPGQSTQITPVPTVSPTPVAAPEVVDARNAAEVAIAAANAAIDQVETAKEECLSVSESFDLDVQELYDSTSLSNYCESLDYKVNALKSKVLSLNVNQVKTKIDANKIIDQSNGFSEEADKLTAQIQDIADELYDTHKGNTSDAYAYVAKDKSRGREYVFKTWLNDRMYNIQLEEDETVIYLEQYDRNEKRFYDQDCENILGFSF
jgi:hypothetical protein